MFFRLKHWHKFWASLTLVALIAASAYILKPKRPISQNLTSTSLTIVATHFAAYDFLRAIIGDQPDIKLIFLLKPGRDAHSFEPSPQDILNLQSADIIVYLGGESEPWADKLASQDQRPERYWRVTDYVDTKPEKDVDGAAKTEEEEEEDSGAFDEHIWTSPRRAQELVGVLSDKLASLRPEKAATFRVQAANYQQKIASIDQEIQKIVATKVRSRLVFGDRMPFQYFIDDYNLQVSAAFNGCSTETEPSIKTIAHLEKIISGKMCGNNR